MTPIDPADSPDVGYCAICKVALERRPLIQSGDLLHGVEGTFAVHVCPGCGAGNTRPDADDAAIARYYPSGYGPHGETAGRLADGLRRLLTRHEMRVGAPRALGQRTPGRVLDVGCGNGTLGSILINRGWKVDGIEPSKAACAEAVGRGVRARVGTLETLQVERGAYDAVIFHQSLEHIGDPRAAIREAFGALAPGGLITISVPNFDCWARRRFGSNWFHLDLPRHRIHYGPRSLHLLLGHAGYESIRLWTSTSSTGLIGSLQYRSSGGLVVREGVVRESLGFLVGLLLVPAASIEQALGGGRDFLHAIGRR
jgi:SAM-dependent methyltransferase